LRNFLKGNDGLRTHISEQSRCKHHTLHFLLGKKDGSPNILDKDPDVDDNDKDDSGTVKDIDNYYDHYCHGGCDLLEVFKANMWLALVGKQYPQQPPHYTGERAEHMRHLLRFVVDRHSGSIISFKFITIWRQ
jgi:hypothetical protein